ncbi:MAG: glucose-6-phosphate isomerase family protein [Asgard group archaeon]|nr:glucose-6-phosphate isomerase family protein [Asgard group archaeon]
MSTIDLSFFVPFSLELDSETNLIMKADNIPLEYNTRKLLDMKKVIFDQTWLMQQEDNFDLYYMYRDFTKGKDKILFQDQNVRYDITIIPPRKLGKEYVKTAGHFHPEAEDKHCYPEVYEVMNGKGLYLLQRRPEDTTEEEIEIIIIEGTKGDQILIPPGYGHVTINPTENETLVMNNLVSSQFDSIYSYIREHNGAAYLYLSSNEWKKNPAYKDKKLKISEKIPKKISNKPFYQAFLDEPDNWEFLNKPMKKENWL